MSLSFTACSATPLGLDGGPGAGSSGGAAGGGGAAAGGGTGGTGGAPASDGGCVEGATVLPGLLVNARDLGGLPTAGGTLPCGRVYRSAAPTFLSPQACGALPSLGLRTVVDLRTVAEATSSPDSSCLTSSARLVPAPMPVPYQVSPHNYVEDLHTASAVRALFAALGDEANYPVLFHCTYGRDRSGVAAALVLLAAGVDRTSIMRDYERTRDNGLGAYPVSLTAALDAIDSAGGIVAFLGDSGVPDEHIATLRRMLR